MGLDQYAYASKRGVKKIELAYWRKHPYLEQYMSELYEQKTGDTDVFNCKILELNAEDLETLLNIVDENNLPEGGGFFWGEDSSYEYREQDIKFCQKGLLHIQDGFKITYTSWW